MMVWWLLLLATFGTICANAAVLNGVHLSSMFAWSGKPGLGQIGDNTLLAISGGIGEAWRCYAGALIAKSTDGGLSFGRSICTIPADWSPPSGHWCTPPEPTPNVSMYGIGNTHGGPVIVGHTATNSATMLFDCIPNPKHPQELKDTAPGGGRVWAVRSTDGAETWGTPWELTSSVQVPPGPGQNGIATTSLAIGGGIEIKHGKHKGRLVVQNYVVKCWGNSEEAKAGRCNRTAIGKHYAHGDPYGESPSGWSEINAFLLSDDGGLSWRATQPFGMYGAEGEVAELFEPPGRLMANFRVDGGMVPRCPGGAAFCNVSGHGVVVACETSAHPLTNPVANGITPHHCRASMISDDGGISWTNAAGEATLFGEGVADLPDVGQKGGFARGPSGSNWLVMSNAQDNRDPGDAQQPRFNLTVSISSDNGRTWPHSKIVWPADLGGTGYSSCKVTNGLIAVHFTAMPPVRCHKQLMTLNCTDENVTADPRACISCAHANKAAAYTACCEDCVPGHPTPGWQPQPNVFTDRVHAACTPWPKGVVRNERTSLLAVVEPRVILGNASHNS
eukprot:COSAG02_NODE_331_length_24480_cov_22.114720_10_plen_561_part_00